MLSLKRLKLQAPSGHSMKNGGRKALDLIRNVADETAIEFGVNIIVRIEEGYPVLIMMII